MSKLEIPTLLSGPWKHCHILTFGADIPFYENALWRQFGRHCHNKIILADGNQYLDASSSYAGREQVRLLNQKYVVDGVFNKPENYLILIIKDELLKRRLSQILP